MDIPTLVLVPLLAAIVLAAALGATRLLRAWRTEGPTLAREDGDRMALEDEKHRLLVVLKDLEFEHQMGKISREDFDGLRRFYEQEAVRVIKALEARP